MNQDLIMDSAVLNKNNKCLKLIQKNNEIEIFSYYQNNNNEYRIIFFQQNNKKLFKSLSSNLMYFLNKYKVKKTLIIGLGNSSIIGDSFGPITNSKIIATNQYNDFLTVPKISLFNPEVTDKTGISSFKLISLVVNELKPDCILIIDSLCTKEIKHLGSCFEINDSGIVPGYYLKDNKEINSKTFNIPVISIGVPLIFSYNDIYLTSSNINQILEELSNLLSSVINKIILS